MSAHDLTLLDPWLRYLWDTGATDLHLAAGTPPRVRIDGRLLGVPEAAPLDVGTVRAMIDGLLTPEEQQAFDAERQLDFAFSWADTARFRVNAFHQLDRPAMALRLIPSEIPTPEQLGLPAVVGQLLNKPYGLVLVTGPTGSGKSTTLASMIGWINQNKPVHILTVEDPVEYVHPPAMALVNQREVGQDAATFEDALRAALREDPDVVLVGEMRDLESIALTLTLAETGHLVFATLHTNDTAQTIDRIIDVFPPAQQEQVRTQLSMALQAVLAQRLVPRVGGGRVAAYEILMGTPAVTNLIREGKVRQIRNVLATGSRDGMQVLEQHLGQLVAAGVITLEEAMAVSVHPEDITGLGTAQPAPTA
ncbi:MAG: type IV pilus twitching motility protein PilT [Microthrixaceae bacterium]